jgi:hypothetical protein
MLVDDDNGELAELLEMELSEALKRIKAVQHSTALEHLWMHNIQF